MGSLGELGQDVQEDETLLRAGEVPGGQVGLDPALRVQDLVPEPVELLLQVDHQFLALLDHVLLLQPLKILVEGLLRVRHPQGLEPVLDPVLEERLKPLLQLGMPAIHIRLVLVSDPGYFGRHNLLMHIDVLIDQDIDLHEVADVV